MEYLVTNSKVEDLQVEEKSLAYIHRSIAPIHKLKLAKLSHEGAEKMKG